MEISSSEEAEFAIWTNEKSGKIAEKAAENLDENQIQRVTHSVTFHRLSVLLNNFQPLRGENYAQSQKLPFGFDTDLKVHLPQRCTDTCTHTKHRNNCANTATDLGVLTKN